MPKRRERKTSISEKTHKTSTGATKFKVRAFARSSRTMQKSKKIDARAYVNEGSLQGRSRWPKPFQNPSPKHLKFRIPLDFFSYFCPRAPQERPKSVQERSKSASRAAQELPRAAKSAPRAPKSAPRAPKGILGS